MEIKKQPPQIIRPCSTFALLTLTFTMGISFLSSCGQDTETKAKQSWPKSLRENQDPKLNKFLELAPGSEVDFAANTNYLDVLRSLNHLPTADSDESIVTKDLTRATDNFGKSIIDISNLPYTTEVAISDVKPWSSWWYPKLEDALFENDYSGEEPHQEDWKDSDKVNFAPLVQYDRFRQVKWEIGNLGTPKSAAAWEKDRFDPLALPWEGLCNAWAFASILMPEPRKAANLTINKGWGKKEILHFDVSDLKALALLTYQGLTKDDLEMYGQKFTGNYDGWIHPDIFPDQFHRLIETQLFEKKQPLIMDYDSGPEVWNVPVYKANYQVSAVDGNPNAIQIRMWTFAADYSDKNDRNFVGTKTKTREYHYILTGKPQGNKFHVESGFWINHKIKRVINGKTIEMNGTDSRKFHPDYIITVKNPAKVTRTSFNPEIEIDIIDELLSISH